jgi:hypothetical protein
VRDVRQGAKRAISLRGMQRDKQPADLASESNSAKCSEVKQAEDRGSTASENMGDFNKWRQIQSR